VLSGHPEQDKRRPKSPRKQRSSDKTIDTRIETEVVDIDSIQHEVYTSQQQKALRQRWKNFMNLVLTWGVVFTWNPESIIQTIFPDNDARQRVKTEIFQHSDWVALDRGTLDRDTAIQRAVSRTGLGLEDITALMYQIPDLLAPVPEMIALIRRIKQTTSIACLSCPICMWPQSGILSRATDLDIFDGKVISCDVHKVKPEVEIYQHLLNHYDLHPSDTIFMMIAGQFRRRVTGRHPNHPL